MLGRDSTAVERSWPKIEMGKIKTSASRRLAVWSGTRILRISLHVPDTMPGITIRV